MHTDAVKNIFQFWVVANFRVSVSMSKFCTLCLLSEKYWSMKKFCCNLSTSMSFRKAKPPSASSWHSFFPETLFSSDYESLILAQALLMEHWFAPISPDRMPCVDGYGNVEITSNTYVWTTAATKATGSTPIL